MKTLQGNFYDLFDELVLIEDEIAILSNRLRDTRTKLFEFIKEIPEKKEKEIPLKNGTFGCVITPQSDTEEWFILIEQNGAFYLAYENGGYDTIGDSVEDSFNKMGYSQKTGRAITFLANATHFNLAKQIKKFYESPCEHYTDEDVLFYRN